MEGRKVVSRKIVRLIFSYLVDLSEDEGGRLLFFMPVVNEAIIAIVDGIDVGDSMSEERFHRHERVVLHAQFPRFDWQEFCFLYLKEGKVF